MNAPLAAAALGALALGCFTAPTVSGPYRCGEERQCPGGMTCDEGLCCTPGATPPCPTLPGPDGRCSSGELAVTWYLDKDLDGFGDLNTARPACNGAPGLPPGQPQAQWLPVGGDCNDEDARVHPGAEEACDGMDNDCDGAVDEGHSLVDLWPDRDNDGYGDASAPAVQRCGPSPGLVPDDGDCNDQDARVHPGAPELCNDRDDDCDGVTDGATVETGAACLNPALAGACRDGLIACVNGGLTCAKLTNAAGVALFPRLERCSGLDDDCDGVVDEQPECGGPTSLLGGAGVAYGAQAVDQPGGNNGNVTVCQKGRPGSAMTFASGTWSGVAGGTHVAWAEKTTGSWDLRKVKLGLRLQFTATLPAGASWSAFGQPMVLLCGPGGAFVRYRVSTANSRLTSSNVAVNEVIPFSTGGDWFSTDARTDLAAINRVELIIQPNLSSPAPNFQVTFQKLGFEVTP